MECPCCREPNLDEPVDLEHAAAIIRRAWEVKHPVCTCKPGDIMSVLLCKEHSVLLVEYIAAVEMSGYPGDFHSYCEMYLAPEPERGEPVTCTCKPDDLLSQALCKEHGMSLLTGAELQRSIDLENEGTETMETPAEHQRSVSELVRYLKSGTAILAATTEQLEQAIQAIKNRPQFVEDDVADEVVEVFQSVLGDNITAPTVQRLMKGVIDLIRKREGWEL